MNEALRILVVEDNPADADFIHEMLSEIGPLSFKIESVARLSAALARLELKGVDLVLLDLGLPDSQGLKTFHQLQKAAPDVPMVVLTGTDDQELAAAAVRDGAQDYLVKAQVSGSLLARAARHALERQKAADAQRELLREKEALLKEVHHRVKNNLQVISSLLRLEAGRTGHPATTSMLDEMQGRIRSMALLHESLYRSGTFAAVDLGAYLRRLTTEAFRALVARPCAIQLRLDLASVHVEMDQAMPCGLLVNELISNCLKHGFPKGRAGEVRVELHRVDGGPQVRVRVSDTGVGLPDDFEAKRGDSLGLQLVSDLARQLRGNLEVGPGPTAAFAVTFMAQEPSVPAVDAGKQRSA